MRKALLYYIVNGRSITADRLPELGLTHLDGMAITQRDVMQGPNGTTGVLFVPREKPDSIAARLMRYVAPDCKVGYYPKEQTWVNAGDGLWLGWYNDQKPGPSDIVRVDATEGRALPLLDGNPWCIPSRDCLPTQFGFDSDGAMKDVPVGVGVKASAAIDWLNDWREGHATGTGKEYTEIIAKMADVLAVNYRIGPKECIALGLFGRGNLDQAAWYMLMDEEVRDVVASIDDAEKKSGEVGTPDT
jgi:hypothetical protein